MINGTTFNITAHNSGEEYAVNHKPHSELWMHQHMLADSITPCQRGFLFVDSIADIPNEGWNGWMYWVNYPDELMPTVGAAEYVVEDGDVVTWYWSSSMNMTPEDSPKVLIINA